MGRQRCLGVGRCCVLNYGVQGGLFRRIRTICCSFFAGRLVRRVAFLKPGSFHSFLMLFRVAIFVLVATP